MEYSEEYGDLFFLPIRFRRTEEMMHKNALPIEACDNSLKHEQNLALTRLSFRRDQRRLKQTPFY